MFERFAIDVLLAAQTVKRAMGILGTKWKRTWCTLERAVRGGKTGLHMPLIGIDEIVYDRFDVMQLATKAVDQVRRGEHKKLRSEDDDCLTLSRYLRLRSQESLTANQC